MMSLSSDSALWAGKTCAHVQYGHANLPAHPLTSLTCFPMPHHVQTIIDLLYLHFDAHDTLPQVFWCTLIPEPVIYLKRQ